MATLEKKYNEESKKVEDLFERYKPYVTPMQGEIWPVLQSKDITNLFDLSRKTLDQIVLKRKRVEARPEGLADEIKRQEDLDKLDKLEALQFDLYNKAYRKAEKKAKG